VFAAHGAHGPPCGPEKPSRHRQFVAATLALSEVEFSAHCEHAALPSASLYVPTPHSAQGPPSLPVKPRLHRHAVSALLPLSELEDAGQLIQVLAAAAPSAVEYVSAGQFTQVPASAAPSAVENLPAAQATHAPALLAPVLSRYLPATHASHSAEPTASLNFPASHCAQWPPSGPVYPTSQRQLSSAAFPLADTAFTGHSVHTCMPFSDVYEFGAQIVHGPPSLP
jgi:hypothetical protein